MICTPSCRLCQRPRVPWHLGLQLGAYLPLGETAILDRLKQILTVEVGVLSSSNLSLLPSKTGLALERLPVELDELRGAVISNEAERVHTEAVHVAERPDDAVLCHGPEERVQGARLLAEEVPGRVMGSGGLRNLPVRHRLDGVNEIREENGILDEENRDVVANDVLDSIRTTAKYNFLGAMLDLPKLPSSV